MTRLEKELSGELGAFWKRNAEKEIAELEKKAAAGEILFGADGVVRWASSNNILPTDVREKLSHTAYANRYSEQASREANDKEVAEFVAGYKANHRISTEELYEMRATFGAGTTVVNVLTGESIAL